jgi:hypothetical protein
MSPDSPEHASIRPPHPLCLALIDRLRDRHGAAIFEVGAGSGRNTRALEAAGFAVNAGVGPYAGALSTHALLHGTPDDIREHLRTIARALEPNAPFYVTFGSVNDARYGTGTQLAPHTFAPVDGDEAGVAHAFFDELRLRRMLDEHWAVEELREENVDEIAGKWAHEQRPLQNSVHWFARLRKLQ